MSAKFEKQYCVEAAHDGLLWSLAWSPSGEFLASCGADGAVRVFCLREDGSLLRISETAPDTFLRTIRSVSWSPDGRSIAAGGFDSTASILRMKDSNLTVQATLELHESEVKSVAFSPSGSLLATCSRDKNAYIWECGLDDDFECIAILHGHKQDVKHVRWHPTLEMLATTSYDDTIRLWKEDYEDWYCCAKLTAHTSTVWSLSFDDDGSKMASVSADKSLLIWHRVESSGVGLAADPQWRVLWKCPDEIHRRSVYSVDWREDMIATGSGDDCIRIFHQKPDDPDAFQLSHSIEKAHDGDVNCVTWHPRNKGLLASCGDDGAISLWRVSAST